MRIEHVERSVPLDRAGAFILGTDFGKTGAKTYDNEDHMDKILAGKIDYGPNFPYIFLLFFP